MDAHPFQRRSVAGREAADAHGRADMERELFDVDLSVGKRHEKKIQHVKPESHVYEGSLDLFFRFRAAFPERETDRCDHGRSHGNIRQVPDVKASEYGVPGPVRE